MNGIRARIDYVLKHSKFAYKTYVVLGSAFFRVLGSFIKTDENAILFSGHSRKYNDSPKKIYEKMILDPKYQNLTYYWALDDVNTNSIPGTCKIVKCDTWSYFITALKCKYWVTCVNIERGLHFKKNNNTYLNTWHGVPIKSISGDESRKNNFGHIDYFCCSGEFEEVIYDKALSVKKNQLIYSGLPRNDELYYVDSTQISFIKSKLEIPENKKIILYAPTWRDSIDGGKTYAVKPPITFSKWKRELGRDYLLLLRTHPYTNSLLGVEFDDFVRDVSNYPNINELLIISDILISDYSATIFDYSILERPIVCFAYDYDEYKNMRGFELDPKEALKNNIVFNEDDLISKIQSMNYQEECNLTKKFKNKYIQFGGHATEICIETLFKKDRG